MPAGTPNGDPFPGAAVQVVLRLPDDVTPIENVQSVIAPTSMYWPSQKSAPDGAAHLVVQPPVSVVVQATLHMMFACTVQEPLQLSPHSVVQSVDPG